MEFVHDFVETRYGQLAEAADAVIPLMIGRDVQAAGFLGDDHDGAAAPRGWVLDQTSRKIFIQDGVRLSRSERINWVRLGADRVLGGRSILKGSNKHVLRSVGDLEKTYRKL